MKTIHISADSDATVKTAKGDALFILDSDVTVTVTTEKGIGIDATSEAVGRDIKIDGHISADSLTGFGIVVGDMKTGRGGGDLTIGRHGVITAGLGVVSYADGEHIVNNGKISGAIGIGASGEGLSINNVGSTYGTENGLLMFNTSGSAVNSGSIGSDAVGVMMQSESSEHLKLVNTGTIDGTQAGIAIGIGSGGRTLIVNHGEITGGSAAIAATDDVTREIIRNDGVLSGLVRLGGGNDLYNGLGGQATEVDGGTGNDIYMVSDKQTKLVEALNEGSDTVKTTVNWTLDSNFENLTLLGKSGLTATGNSESNVVRGNAGANILYGLDSDDVLSGGKGDDILYGGADYDTFVFSKGGGHDHIGDFDSLRDIVDLRGIAGLDTFSDILAHASETNSGVVMHFGAGDVLTFDGAHIADLAQDHFMF